MAVDMSPWDANKAWANGAASDDPAAFYNGICAGKKAGDPKTQGAHALPYKYHPGDGPNAAGVRNALSRLPQTEGLTNKAEAQATLEAALKEVQAAEGKDAKKSASVKELRAEFYGGRILRYRPSMEERSGGFPGGGIRVKTCPAEFRGTITTKDGRQFYEVDGYASVFNRGYEMWDMFGSYTETMGDQAFTRSLMNAPDVSFLTNHRGVTMARTTNETLTVRADNLGLHMHGFLNYARQDVKDIACAIDDKLITEMSFAGMFNEGEWDEDFEDFRVTEVDIDRGDVSAVNYGANPYTSIEARAADWLADAERMPPVVLREMLSRAGEFLYRDAAVDLSERARARYMRQAEMQETRAAAESAPVEAETPEPEKRDGGKSLKIWQMRLSSDN